MLKLDNILTIYNDAVTSPVIANDGWALDVYSPTTFKLTPNCNIKLDAGFGLTLPAGIGGLISPKNDSPFHFSVSPGQLIHPQFKDELNINLKYHGHNEEHVLKGDLLCQIVFIPMVKITE